MVMVVEEFRSRGGRPAGRNRVAAPGIPAGTTKYLYYSSQWQVVEERWNGTAASNVQYQYVWSAAYVNGMVLRDTYVAGTAQPDLRIYTQTDADWNATALVGYDPATQTWGVVERFVYSPYGTVTVLSPAWTAQADAFNWQYLYQGGRQDTTTGLYLFQHRNYSPSLGTWTSQDPLSYINGANTYQFVMSNPVDAVDPWGRVLAKYQAGGGTFEVWIFPSSSQHPWESAVKVFFKPSAAALKNGSCAKEEVRIVQYVATAYPSGYRNGGSGWHLDDAHKGKFYRGQRPYFLQQIPWKSGGVSLAQTWDSPSSAGVAISQVWKDYAVLYKGPGAPVSYGYVEYGILYYYGGPAGPQIERWITGVGGKIGPTGSGGASMTGENITPRPGYVVL